MHTKVTVGYYFKVTDGYCQRVELEIYEMETAFLPERLKRIREERGLNKSEAARLLNLSKMGYQRYETTARVPSYQTIVFMAQKLATSPEYLIGLTDDPEPKELIISKESDPEVFSMVRDIISTDHPARDRLLAYYKKIREE